MVRNSNCNKKSCFLLYYMTVNNLHISILLRFLNIGMSGSDSQMTLHRVM